MKGRLIKTSRGWEVQYEEKNGVVSNGKNTFPMYQTKSLLLHPDSTFIEYPNHSFEGKNVEFEMVNDYEEPIGDIQYAKLIIPKQEDHFKEVKESITNSTKNSGYSVYIPESAKKQEETTTWDDIEKEYNNYTWEKGKNKQLYLNFEDWLKEYYNVPTKKK